MFDFQLLLNNSTLKSNADLHAELHPYKSQRQESSVLTRDSRGSLRRLITNLSCFLRKRHSKLFPPPTKKRYHSY